MSGRRALRFLRRVGLTALLAAALPALAAKGAKPEFGPNVLIFDPSMPSRAIQKQINAVYAIQQHNEFSPQRNALLFLPGSYSVDVPVGFYTEVMGLGASPDATRIAGNMHADASHAHNNATTTFWRAAEGISIAPAGGTMQWAVSQAVSLRRMHVRGDLVLHQHHGWASGGWMSDSLVDGNVDSGSQQQWISRNCDWKSWTGSNWNMVFVGVVDPPDGAWPSPPYTTVAHAPVVREKPFLQVNAAGEFSVRVPELRHDSIGITWRSGETPGETIPIAQFYIARPDIDTAATINAQLAQGKNLILTPGIYDLAAPIRVTRPHTVVLGLGFATLRPIKGTAAMTTDDADGIEIAGLLFDAGPSESPVLLEVGPEGSRARHALDPITLNDVFFRVGGAGVGRAKVNLKINSNDTLVDHTWIWRADHGDGVGWDLNTSENGLVVNGNEVTIYGLFVEHHQQFQVLWNGNGGRAYFYQSEIPYDPPNQPSYTSAPGVNGWASYKVAEGVTSHEAWGLGVYSVFELPDVVLTRAIETPKSPEVRFHDVITVALGEHGGISHVIDDTGEATSIHPRVTPKVTNFP
ncbi:Coagulation factor 5/8 type domain-containing protein [Candidatus Sulfotelmatobacter kueseliae]|uniref:Coagulation factor 5/8 type domain-containing protein n=1 Tax=Candidatus Sulfotelmatobacter kueseliae TaxID=2042962 RepID=A0A2U3JY63_9BACT|nr:Coagulation factor 5/8 type domain-containing protein [Candidatus Sulfotelmatobacter kueseliae]